MAPPPHWTTTPFKAVLDSYRELANTENGLGAGSKEETGATWTAPFANGVIGVMPYPNTSLNDIFDAEASGGFEVGVTPIAGTSGNTSTFLGGDAMGISKDCKNVAQAWNFLHWLMQSDTQAEVFAANGYTASNIEAEDRLRGCRSAHPDHQLHHHRWQRPDSEVGRLQRGLQRRRFPLSAADPELRLGCRRQP